MEYLLLGALGGLGYVMSRDGRTRRRHLNPIRPEPSTLLDDQTMLLEEDLSVYEQKYAESIDPTSTGIIPPKTVLHQQQQQQQGTVDPVMVSAQPYFSSERKQHTSSYLKQTRMELFTGALDEGKSTTGHYRNKMEQKPLFEPGVTRAQITSAGSAGNPMFGGEDRDQRYVTTNTFNNMRPTEQIQVGPGLNVGPDVPATGGFHQFFRVMPKNVNEYRKHNLKGGVIPGKRPVAEVPRHVNMKKNAVDREFETPGFTGTKSAAFNAVQSRPEYQPVMKVPPRTLGDQAYFGGAAGATYGVRAPYGSLNSGRNDNTDRGSRGLLNLTDTDTGLGAYATKDVQLRDTDRGQGANTGLTGVRGEAPRMYVKETQRELAPTNRSTMATVLLGGPGGTVPDATIRSVNKQRPTNRETTHGFRLGGAGRQGTDTVTDRTSVVRNVDKAKARRDRTNVGWTPGPERINRGTNDPGTVATKKGSAGYRVSNMSSLDTGSRVLPVYERRNALTPENPRVTQTR
jgi:hypothetical protein